MKIFLFLSILLNLSFASYEQIRIGKIDDYHKNKITEQELIILLKQVEDLFESELRTNIFDYSQSGKPIDILYVSNNKLEENLNKKIEKLNIKKEKIAQLQSFFPSKKDEITQAQNSLNIQTNILNTKIEILNNYVKDINNKKNISKNEYNNAVNYIKSQKDIINQELKIQKNLQSDLTRILNNYNQKVFIYNNLIQESNNLLSEIESINRSVKIINGKTFGFQETTLKTSYKDGKEIQEKSIKTSMDRIEIYSFNSKEELKAILAHEIAHLIGIPHIEAKGALMNPILQENQKIELSLTSDDLEVFRKKFVSNSP